ncbi:MAG: hypothetical protein AAF533_18255 [Acidobacteriota bacterium]
MNRSDDERAPEDVTADEELAPSSEARSESSRRRLLLTVFLAATLVPLAFALFTQQVWEDYFITFRHSRNWALGQGLVHQPGETIHGFTSPLNVLIPAIFDKLFGVPESYLPALWAYRLVSILAFALSALALAELLWRQGVDRWLILFFTGLHVVQVRAVAFTINGQEAGFTLAALAFGLMAAQLGHERAWKMAGLAWGGLMWSRPDGCVLVAVLGIVGLIYRRASFRDELVGQLKAAATCTAVYLPWFAGAWIYYGTPVPHTVTAKFKMALQGLDPVLLVRLVLEKTFECSARCFEPIYSELGGWPAWVGVLSLACGLIAMTAWLWPVADRLIKMTSLSCLLSVLYLSYVTVKSMRLYPWYTPAAAMLGLLAVTLVVPALARRLADERWRRWATWLPLGLLGVGFLQLFFASATQVRLQQELVEMQGRRQLGLYLSEVVGEDETIYLEALGYIGYFSGKKMLDYPGLASPQVVAARREHGDNMFDVVPALSPDWLVLRPPEAAYAASLPELRLLEHYDQDRYFDARPAIEELTVHGKPFLLGDATWIIFKKKPDAS